MGTLVINSSNSVRTSTSAIILYNLSYVTIPEYPEPLLLENYIRIVALCL